jgi:hypothetical protein
MPAYTVCSTFPFNVYYDAIGLELTGHVDSANCVGYMDLTDHSIVYHYKENYGETIEEAVEILKAVLRPGDILTAGQVEEMTFVPLRTQQDMQTQVLYLPIYENRVEQAAAMNLSIRGKEDKVPAAMDGALETYKNLSNDGVLNAADPEGQSLTYTLVRQPRRGSVQIREDGTYTYTPKKNKVGVDSFTYTVADPGGNVSREATVTVQILKPVDAMQYRDTAGESCRFAAQWLRDTGLFAGETVGGELCFYPDKAVSRGEFLTMLVQMLDIPVEEVSVQEAPDWVQPYLAAAIRSGLVTGWQQESFHMNEQLTGAEAAVVLQNALDLPVGHEEIVYDQEVPAWAATSLAIMAENGLEMEASAPLTRADTAQILYQVSRMAVGAPGMTVFNMQS